MTLNSTVKNKHTEKIQKIIDVEVVKSNPSNFLVYTLSETGRINHEQLFEHYCEEVLLPDGSEA